MNNKETISTLMTESVVTTTENSNIYDVINLIQKNHIRHVPVINEEQKVVGIISSTDLNRLTFGNLFEGQDTSDEPILNMLTISQVMTSHPKTVNASDTIKEVAEVFSTADYHSMPVIENDKIVGIITTTDLIKHLLNQYELA